MSICGTVSRRSAFDSILRALPALNSASTRNDNFAILSSPVCANQTSIFAPRSIWVLEPDACKAADTDRSFSSCIKSSLASSTSRSLSVETTSRSSRKCDSIRARQSGDSSPSARLIKSFTISSARPSLTASAINKTDAASSGLG